MILDQFKDFIRHVIPFRVIPTSRLFLRVRSPCTVGIGWIDERFLRELKIRKAALHVKDIFIDLILVEQVREVFVCKGIASELKIKEVATERERAAAPSKVLETANSIEGGS